MNDRPGTYREASYTPKLAGLDDIGSSLITLTVNLDQYRRNLRAILEFVAPARMIAVVKANAYGFGVAGLLPILSEFEHVSLGVANADEALELRALGYPGRIILLGYTHPKNYYQIVHSGCQLCAYRPENIPPLAEACRKLAHPLALHVKVDTGMARLGIALGELAGFLRTLKQHPEIAVVGLFSHLVDSGTLEAAANQQQVMRFMQAIRIAEGELGYRPECHLANSGALLNFPDLNLDSLRVGILAYGVEPPGDLPPDRPRLTEPCFRLASEVIDVHRLSPGDGVSYCHSFITPRPTTIVTMPLGYADGLPRGLGGRGRVLLRGASYPLVGNVTMDYVMADVGDTAVAIGDEAVFIGGQGRALIPPEEVAELAGVIPYELSCAWGRRVRREYVED